MSDNRGSIRVGIGGWVYPPWRGTFYPPGLPQAQELAHASRHLTAIEINGTFYNSGRPESFRKWRGETPEERVDSLFALRELQERTGSIQEVIIQNFRVKPDIRMRTWGEPRT